MSHLSMIPLKRFAQELARCNEQEARLLFAKEFMACRDALKDFNPSNASSRHATSQALLKLTVSTLYSGKYAKDLLPHAATLISSKCLAHKTVGYQVLTYVLPHVPVTIWERFLLNSLQKQITSPSVDDRCLALQFMANNMPPSSDLLEATGPLVLPLLTAKKQPYDVTTASFKFCCKLVCCARDSMAFLESPVFFQVCAAGLQAAKRALDHHAASPTRLDRFIVMRTATAFVHSFAVLSQEVALQEISQFAEADLSDRKSLSGLLHDCVHSLIACYYFTSSKETFPEDAPTYHTVIDPFWQIEALQTVQLCADELNQEFSLSASASAEGRVPPKARRRLQEIVHYMLDTKRRVVRDHGGPDQAYSNIRASILLEVTNIAISFPYMQTQAMMQDVCYRITNLMGEDRGRRSNLLGMKHLDLLLERNPVDAMPAAFQEALRKNTLPYLEGLLRKTGAVVTDSANVVLGEDEEGDARDLRDLDDRALRDASRAHGRADVRAEGDDTITLLAASRSAGRHRRASVRLEDHMDLGARAGAGAAALRVSGQHLLLGARVLLRLTSLGLYPFNDCVELLQPLAQGGERVLQAYSLSQLNSMLLETLRSQELLGQLDYFDLASYVVAVLRQKMGVVRRGEGEHSAEAGPDVPKRAPRTLLGSLASGEWMGGSLAFAQKALRDLEGIAGEVAEKYSASGNEGVYDLHMLVTGALEHVSSQTSRAPQDRDAEVWITAFCSQTVIAMIRRGCMASCDPRVALRMSEALRACAARRGKGAGGKPSAGSAGMSSAAGAASLSGSAVDRGDSSEPVGSTGSADSCALASLLMFTFAGGNDETLEHLSRLTEYMSPRCVQGVYGAIAASEDGARLRAHLLGEKAAERRLECRAGQEDGPGAEKAENQAPVDVKEQIVLPCAAQADQADQAGQAEEPVKEPVKEPAQVVLEPLIEFPAV